MADQAKPAAEGAGTPAVGAAGAIVWKGSLKKWLAVLGPTAILASIAMGPGTIASNLGAGSKLGYGIGWLIALSALWAVVSLYLVGKTTAVTRLSVIEQYWTYYHKAVAIFIGVLMIIIIIPVEAFTGVVIGHSLNFMFPWLSPLWWTVICFALVVYIYFLGGGFKWVTLLCTILVVFMTLAFLVNAIVVGPDVGKLLRGLVVPWLPSGREGTMLFVGILGGSAGILGMLFYGYTVRNAGWTTKDVPVMAWDTIVFVGILFFIFSIGIYISGVALMGEPIGQAIQAAASLEPVAGPFARWLFATGYFAATFTSGAAGAYIVGYILHDFFKWKVDGDLHKDPWFRLISIVVLASWFLGPAAATFMPPIMLLVFAMGLFNLATPPVVALSLILGRSRKVMGEHRVGWFVTIMVSLLLLFSVGAVYVFVVRVIARAG
jgi:Mn2+/Fe2+ NRAMP family transporter